MICRGGLVHDRGEVLGSNADVADSGISQRTRSDEIRPTIRPWPLPPLRPKRDASGVAGLRYGSGQRKTNHALMSETSADKPQPEAIPLNIYVHDFCSVSALVIGAPGLRVDTAPKASGCFLGGTQTIERAEPEKQKPRSCRAQE